jgi:hypothetical protein
MHTAVWHHAAAAVCNDSWAVTVLNQSQAAAVPLLLMLPLHWPFCAPAGWQPAPTLCCKMQMVRRPSTRQQHRGMQQWWRPSSQQHQQPAACRTSAA